MAKRNIDDKEADKRIAHMPRLTERKASYVMADELLREQFEDTELIVFRAELELLMGEYKRHEIAFAVNHDKATGTEARYVGEFLEQNEDLVCKELQKRLHLSEGLIKQYLANISNVMRAKFATDELLNPYTGESTGFSAGRLQPKKKRGERGKSKEKKKPKQGRKKAILGFASIAEASRVTGESYDYLRRIAEKEAT